MFTVVDPSIAKSPQMSAGGSTPNKILHYKMEPPSDNNVFEIIEFAAVFSSVPDDLSEYVTGCRTRL